MFDVTERALASRFAVQPSAAGGYSRAKQPNPNDAMEIRKRNLGPTQAPVGGGETIQPGSQIQSMLYRPSGESGESALSQNVALSQRAREHSAQYNAGEAERRALAGNTGQSAIAPMVTQSSQWDALLQALYESGADHLSGEGGMVNMGQRTTAADGAIGADTRTTYRKQAGFFGTQRPQISKALASMSPRERLLMDQMQKQDAVMNARTR
jgi:hypothetical protein